MKIVAALSRRFEPDYLVEELHQNLSWCDEVIVYDDRGRDPDDLEWNEHRRYTQLNEWAGQANATHVIATAPDERWSEKTEEALKEAIYQNPDYYFCTPSIELYDPTHYRADGDWATSFQCRVYPWQPGQEYTNYPVHNLCVPIHLGEHEKLVPDAIQYHLKHIEHQNIAARIESFRRVDPEGEYSLKGEGYGYLADETGIILKEIEQPYFPPYSQPYIFEEK